MSNAGKVVQAAAKAKQSIIAIRYPYAGWPPQKSGEVSADTFAAQSDEDGDREPGAPRRIGYLVTCSIADDTTGQGLADRRAIAGREDHAVGGFAKTNGNRP